LVGISEGKSLLGKLRCRGEDSITLDLREIGWEVVERIHVAQDRNQWRAAVNK
jgi:hypothetical protein